jgi:hypothetical protein
LQASLRGYFDLPEAMKQLRQYGFRVFRPIEALMLAGMNKQTKPSHERRIPAFRNVG